jgi:hypothetical protein
VRLCIFWIGDFENQKMRVLKGFQWISYETDDRKECITPARVRLGNDFRQPFQYFAHFFLIFVPLQTFFLAIYVAQISKTLQSDCWHLQEAQQGHLMTYDVAI